jgi:hypothetical protein
MVSPGAGRLADPRRARSVGYGPMTEVRPESVALAWDDESGGVRWHVELDRAVLLPGRLVGGRMSLVADRGIAARQLQIALVGEEHWRHEETSRDANGNTTTRTVTSRHELPRVPEVLHGPLVLAAGERWESPFDLPVPPLGPATLDAQEAAPHGGSRPSSTSTIPSIRRRNARS